MSILYLLTSPIPDLAGTDAVFQEVQTLQAVFNGVTVNLFPLRHPNSSFPFSLYGLHAIRHLRHQEAGLKLNHLFASSLYYFPVFRCMTNPIIYTVAASLHQQSKPANVRRLNQLQRIVISNQRDRRVLDTWGIHNYSIVLPGIDTSQFSRCPRPLEKELTLLLASAPWEKHQFYSKGVDLLLEAAARLPLLNLILLWRGVLYEELQKRICRYGVSHKVEVVNRKVDVNAIMKRVHATILLAERADLVRAFPFSLVESLAAGKPVIVSATIPMADYVRRNYCGVVVEDLSMESLDQSLCELVDQYQHFAKNASQLPGDEFSIERMIGEYRGLYGPDTSRVTAQDSA